MDLEEQYDKIYRCCYFRLHSRELAEDVTQETFLRYFEHDYRLTSGAALRCLYTIARNLCVDVSRSPRTLPLEEIPPEETTEEQTMTGIAVKSVLSKLDDGERELLLLRYVNEVPVAEIGRLLGISRFAVYRKLLSASNRLREELRKEDLHE